MVSRGAACSAIWQQLGGAEAPASRLPACAVPRAPASAPTGKLAPSRHYSLHRWIPPCSPEDTYSWIPGAEFCMRCVKGLPTRCVDTTACPVPLIDGVTGDGIPASTPGEKRGSGLNAARLWVTVAALSGKILLPRSSPRPLVVCPLLTPAPPLPRSCRHHHRRCEPDG